MIPWKLIDTARIPRSADAPGQSRELSPGTQLRLCQRGDEYSIRVDDWELMNSRSHSSEQELAELADLRGRPGLCVLIGGLGMGYTLAAALARLDATSRVVVAELVPSVVKWNRDFIGHLAGDPLGDPRTSVREVDVAEILRTSTGTFDAILLDVDNGPATGTIKDDGWIYTQRGLEAARTSLRPGGVLTIWASDPCDGFLERLERARFAAEEVYSRGRGRKGSRYRIWVAKRN